MQACDLMNLSVVSITPNESASPVVRLLSRHNVGSPPVRDEDGSLRGIVIDRDIILHCVAAEKDPLKTQVKDTVTRNRAVVSPDDDARETAWIMAIKQMRRLSVPKGGKMVGIVSLGDLAQCRRLDTEVSKAFCEISD